MKSTQEKVTNIEEANKVNTRHQNSLKKTKARERTNKKLLLDFPGSTVGKNLPANAGDTGYSPVPGRSHMLWSN